MYYDLHVYKSVNLVKVIFIDKLTELPLRCNGKNFKEDEHIIAAAHAGCLPLFGSIASETIDSTPDI